LEVTQLARLGTLAACQPGSEASSFTIGRQDACRPSDLGQPPDFRYKPVGQSINSFGILNRLDKCVVSAFTPKTSVA